MSKFIKITAFCLIAFCCFAFSSCTTVSQSIIFYADGSRQYQFDFQFDSEELTAENINVNQLLASMPGFLDSWWQSMTEGVEYEGVHFSHSRISGTTDYQAIMTFDSLEAYYNFYDYHPEDEEQEFENHFLYSRYVIYDGVCDVDNFTYTELYSYLANFMTTNFFDGDISKTTRYLDKITVNMVRAYPTAYKVRSNADYIGSYWSNAGVNHSTQVQMTGHMWTTTLNDTHNDMYIYQDLVLPNNRTNWYLLALGITALFGIVFLIIQTRKNKTQIIDGGLTQDKENDINNREIIWGE